MQEKIQSVIDTIRPMLQADGGDVELVGYQDGVVKVRLKGACSGCPMSQMTLRNGIERLLKQELPEIKSVVQA
jgi:Fe-S cluster biogenesis protein NfuA